MKKVLLVEDDAFIRDLTSVKLVDRNFEVITALTGEDALSSIKEHTPDAVLLDLDLPDMPGLQVIERLQKDDQLKNIPVVIFSNNDDEKTLQEAMALGAAAFFIKATTSFDDLCVQLEKLIGGHH